VDPIVENDDELELQPQRRNRQGSVTSMNSTNTDDGPTEKQIRMPPSLTLSKIRSLKHQALHASVRAKLEIGTVALACVYFERLCLDCRVDKSNRRLAFASCLLLASKLNEPNVGSVNPDEETDGKKTASLLRSLIRPNNRSNTMFASLLEFFTQEWELSLKNLFDAEWGVFAALGFSLHATPSQVAFHFKRLLKTLDWKPLNYLGKEMYTYWQETLKDEDKRKRERDLRRERRRRRREKQLIDYQIETDSDLSRRKQTKLETVDDDNIADSPYENEMDTSRETEGDDFKNMQYSPGKQTKKASGIKLLQRFGMRRVTSKESLVHSRYAHTSRSASSTAIKQSASTPSLIVDDSGKSFFDSVASSPPRTNTKPLIPVVGFDSSVIVIDMPPSAQNSQSSADDVSVKSQTDTSLDEGIMIV
jgi:hypothetical protein